MNKLALLLSSLALALAPVAGGCGMSSDEVRATCEQLQEEHRGCMEDAELDACQSCYEDCDDACAVATTACPLEFSCPN